MSIKTIVVCDYCNAEIGNTSTSFSVISGSETFSLIQFETSQCEHAHDYHVHDYCAEAELKSWLHKREEERIKEYGLQNYNER